MFICLLVMAVPQVDKKMLGELEAMGFPTARSVRALHFSGMPFQTNLLGTGLHYNVFLCQRQIDNTQNRNYTTVGPFYGCEVFFCICAHPSMVCVLSLFTDGIAVDRYAIS